MSAPPSTSYDVFPYPSYCFPQTHPDRLAVVATLLGLTPPPVERCRVLELGCAGGSNLIPIAEELPKCTFLGIDLSQLQIAEGQKWSAELGLTNIELRHQSILDFDAGSETYDYILCHGVYSWVPPEVQDRILTICQKHLHPDGVAFISYNTLPGWHMRGMIRDMMLFHGRRFSDPRQKVAQARALLDFLATSVKTENNPYGLFLRSELEFLRQQPDSYLFHDHLEEHNSPIYFHQFVERATTHGLRFLADVELSAMEFSRFPPEVGKVLQRLTADLVQLEQYIDFLQNRTFSQTLLCHARHEPNYRVQTDKVKPMFVGSPVKPTSQNPDLRSFAVERFDAQSGAYATSSYPIVKAAFMVLAEEWPQVVPFAKLRSRARAKLQDRPLPDETLIREDEQQLGQALIQFYTIASGLVELRSLPLRLTIRPGSQPLARPLARSQARSGMQVTNLRHESVTLNEFGRQLLLALDGQRPRSTLVRQMTVLVESGALTIQQNGQKITEPQRIEPLLVQSIDQQLDQFAQRGLLLA